MTSNDEPAEIRILPETGSGDEKKPIDIPPGMLTMRNVFRWFTVLWFLVALFLLISGIVDIIGNWRDLGSYASMFAVAGIVFAASVFWIAPDWFINRYTRSIADAMDDPDKEIHTVNAGTATSEFSRVEIVSKALERDSEPLPKEDEYGRIIFDSTQRQLRVLFGGVFLGIGLVIGLVIYLASDEIGFIEVFWVIGWCTFCLVAMGWVNEIAIIKIKGVIEKKTGWFFIVRKQRYNIRDFDRILVESTFQRSRYDSTRGRYHSRDPKFRVDLAGKRRLNIRVFNRLSDARRLAKALADCLDLPLAEASEVHP